MWDGGVRDVNGLQQRLLGKTRWKNNKRNN